MSDFGNFEATEEEWDWVIGWSYLLIEPILAALYLALRNFKRMPVLATFTALFALFHIATTIADYGLIPTYVPDFRFGYDETTGKVDLDAFSFLRFSAVFAIPFLIVYFIPKIWPWRKADVVGSVS
jgi:hypothetical protein